MVNEFGWISSKLLAIFLLLDLTSTSGAKTMSCTAGWGYIEEDGPPKWSSFCPACSGSRQSPIVIQPDKLVLRKLAPINFINYEKPLQHLPLLDTGRSEQLRIPHESGLSIQIPTRPGVTYELAQIHFHWGSKNQGHGSEHGVGERFYPFEVHLVHKANVTMFAVLAVFGEVHCDGENAALSVISKAVPGTINPRDIVKLHSEVKVRDLLPKDPSLFYAYSGSLTTPPCSEIVEWFIFEQPIHVSPTLMERLRGVISNDNKTMVENNRPVQPLNDREVIYTGSKRPVVTKPSTSPLKC